MGSWGPKNDFYSGRVPEPSGFEPLTFYCTYFCTEWPMSSLYAEEIWIALPGKRLNDNATDENFMKLLFFVFI